MSIVHVCVTVKMHFPICKYSIIFTIGSIAMFPRPFGPPLFKNSGSARKAAILKWEAILNFKVIGSDEGNLPEYSQFNILGGVHFQKMAAF